MQREFTLIIIYMISPSATMCLDNLCRYKCRCLFRYFHRYLCIAVHCSWIAPPCRPATRAEAETTNKDNITEVTRSWGAELTFRPEYLETVTWDPLVARKQPRCLWYIGRKQIDNLNLQRSVYIGQKKCILASCWKAVIWWLQGLPTS